MTAAGVPAGSPRTRRTSLGVLVYFKVVPVSVLAVSPVLQLGGESSFDASVLLPRGVPNSPAPPVPLLTARPTRPIR